MNWKKDEIINEEQWKREVRKHKERMIEGRETKQNVTNLANSMYHMMKRVEDARNSCPPSLRFNDDLTNVDFM